MTISNAEREAALIEAGLLHKGECACGVGSRGVLAKLYRCYLCGVRSCYHCTRTHVCETAK